MQDDDESDMEHMGSGVQLAWFGLEYHAFVLILARLGLVVAVPEMVDWLVHEILSSPSYSWWFPPSPLISLLPVLNSTITWEYEIGSSLSISICHNHELKLSIAYTQDCIHWVQHQPKIDCLPLPGSFSSLITWKTMLYTTLYIPKNSRLTNE